MPYPDAPWNLKGYALFALHLIEIERASNVVPPDLEIVSLLPGKTLGGIYLSSYESGSLLQYNELIVAPALVRYKNKIGGWISHIYVDNEDSVAGGREIWGLPKEMAEFTWDKDRVCVRQNNIELCNLSYNKSLFKLSSIWPLGISGGVFGGLSSELLYFSNTFKSRIETLTSQLNISPNSPFADLNFAQPFLTLSLNELDLFVKAPDVVRSA